MNPIENCPVCKIKVQLIIHSNYDNYFQCSNIQCPISFFERIRFSKIEINYNLQNGLLTSYSFIINNYLIEINYEEGITIIKSKNEMTKRPIFCKIFDINWNNLDLLKSKIATIINFS